MRLERRAGAPRLIEWTGERCVPWAPDVQMVYEHLHRYLWASRLVAGRRVLDLASGEGFGAAILSEHAESVVGIDLDEPTVAHSNLNYGRQDLEFQVGDAADLSRFVDGTFGAVVAFEMIEHVQEQDRVLDEIARVLGPGGLLMMSTPDRRAYGNALGQHNPFHVRELSQEEFISFLCRRFAHVAIWGQRTVSGSVLSAVEHRAGAASEPSMFLIDRDREVWHEVASLSPLYLVALASDEPIPAVADDSTLADAGLQLLRMAEASAAEEAARSLRLANAEIAAAEDRVAGIEAERVRATQQLSEALRAREAEIDFQRRRAGELSDQLAANERELASVRRALQRVELSVTWRAFERVRRALFGALGGEGSSAVNMIQALLRFVGRVARLSSSSATAEDLSAPAAVPPIVLPQFGSPHASIVIPLFSGAELTRRCLESIRDRTSLVSYEVILVDDGADQATKDLLGAVHGARVVVNDSNLGYLRSVNRGAAIATGRWLVLCNNDIELTESWLAALIGCAESDPQIGVVAPKYVAPDGRLSEAGGILWSDGTGMNYGRGAHPDEWRYEFRRDVDYGSAAALLVRASLWRELRGYDEQFVPMYYEDADLCLRVWERGQRVVYEPRAVVVHVEGGTAGTDLDSGHKRHQQTNRTKFVTKWGERLRQEHLPDSRGNIRAASNRRRGRHVMIIDFRVPTWDRDAGSVRARGMIEAIHALGHTVTFVPDNLYAIEPYARELQAHGVEVWHGAVDPRAELAEVGPGLAMVISCRPTPTSRWIELIREYAPGVPLVYDTVDLHWLREARRDAWAQGVAEISIGPRAKALRELELALIRATDATLVVSEEELGQVLADVPDADVQVVPMVHEVRTDVPAAAGREGVLFLGGFEHPPNIDAALRLVRRVMPAVWRELGQVPVTIVGADPPPEVRQLAGPLVEVTGWVKELEPLLDRARAMVAPLNYGAGLKGKLTQSLACGLPVVTTPVGAEGLHASDGAELLIGASDEELAARVVRLTTDDELWHRLSAAGLALAIKRWSPQVMRGRLGDLMERLAVARTPDAGQVSGLRTV